LERVLTHYRALSMLDIAMGCILQASKPISLVDGMAMLHAGWSLIEGYDL
jgi:hypothetical protein